MRKSFDFRRARPWEVALTVFALSAPLLLSFTDAGSNGFVRHAVAQEMQQVDSSKLVAIGGAVTEIVYALGEGGRLVARDSTSTFPDGIIGLAGAINATEAAFEGYKPLTGEAIRDLNKELYGKSANVSQ